MFYGLLILKNWLNENLICIYRKNHRLIRFTSKDIKSNLINVDIKMMINQK